MKTPKNINFKYEKNKNKHARKNYKKIHVYKFIFRYTTKSNELKACLAILEVWSLLFN
jgi:hypothetical protein